MAGNLLAKATLRDVNHDFALPGAQRADTLAEIGRSFPRRIDREPASKTGDSSRRELIRGGIVGYSDRKAIERGRYKAVVTHKINQLRQASFAEESLSMSISRLRKHAAVDESRRDIVAGSLLFCQVTWSLPGSQRRQSGIADLVLRFCYRRVSVDFVRRLNRAPTTRITSWRTASGRTLKEVIAFVTVQKAAPTSR